MAGRISARTSRLAPIVLATAALGLMLAACGSSGSSDQASTASGPGQQGSPSVGSSLRIPASGTRLMVTVRRVIFPLRGSGMLLSPGDAAAGVQVSVRNVGPGDYDSSSESDVKLRSSSGEEAEPGFASRGECATLEVDFLRLISPGESRSGCVAFDVPRGTKPAAVRFAPQGRGGRVWVVPG